MRREGMLAAWLAAAGLLGLGCGGREMAREEAVPLEKVPAAALKAAQQELPDVKFKEAWKGETDGVESYEIRGHMRSGRTRDVRVAADGRVLEVD
jgi:hypothetical protein